MKKRIISVIIATVTLVTGMGILSFADSKVVLYDSVA